MSTTLCSRVRLVGTIEIALPPEQAFMLFTPSGERAWAHGWDPSFPVPVTDETEPGTVFLTLHGQRESIWTVVRCTPGRLIAYSVVTPEERCGLVTVGCEASRAGTAATVSYDLSSLRVESNPDLEQFAAGYRSFLSHWESSIGKSIDENCT